MNYAVSSKLTSNCFHKKLLLGRVWGPERERSYIVPFSSWQSGLGWAGSLTLVQIQIYTPSEVCDLCCLMQGSCHNSLFRLEIRFDCCSVLCVRLPLETTQTEASKECSSQLIKSVSYQQPVKPMFWDMYWLSDGFWEENEVLGSWFGTWLPERLGHRV